MTETRLPCSDHPGPLQMSGSERHSFFAANGHCHSAQKNKLKYGKNAEVYLRRFLDVDFAK